MTDNLKLKLREIYIDGLFELVRTYDISPIPQGYIDGLEYVLDKIDPLILDPTVESISQQHLKEHDENRAARADEVDHLRAALAEARAAEKAVQRACDDWEAEARKVRGDLDEARAEVESVRSALLYNGGSLPPGMTVAEAVERLARGFDRLNTDLLAGDRAPVTASSATPPDLDVNALSQIIRLVDGNHSLGAGALAEAILDHLPAPQIIRTVQDFEALDPETVVLCGRSDVLVARKALNYGRASLSRVLPAVVVAEGEHLRACQEARGEATP